MALTTQQRKEILIDIADRLSAARLNWPLTKADTQAAIDAIDDFLDENATAINQAFPTAARTGLNAGQKAALVGYVALKRNGVV
jgi:hypothetical protein